MKLVNCIKLVDNYTPIDSMELKYKDDFLSLLSFNNVNVFYKDNEEKHITASAWIVNYDFNKVLLLRHKKLGKYLQPGGHSGKTDKTILDTAFREAIEETNLNKIELFTKNIFDIDIHKIEQNTFLNKHYHYDIRFIFLANEKEVIRCSDESTNIEWFDFNTAEQICKDDISMVRMINKTKLNKKHL